MLFVDSADKAARFIWCCDAFNVPLVFLADVPGFMIGTEVERQGIIRHGAKMITAVSEATVPKVSVIVRKAYGAGLYAMSGPAFEPEATIALPTAKIAVMGPEAAVNAVFANKIAAIDDPAEREAFVAEQRRIYEEDVDLLRLASELVIDAVVDLGDLRARDRAAGCERAGRQDPTLHRSPPRRAARLMPWCEDCSKFWNPNSLPPDGTCPTCGRMIGRSSRHPSALALLDTRGGRRHLPRLAGRPGRRMADQPLGDAGERCAAS